MTDLKELRDALIAVDPSGIIGSILHPHAAGYDEALEAARRSGSLETLPAQSYLLPGFVDLHVHAPQYPQLGRALDVPLEVWLHKYTFPLEARYADLAFARRSYGLLVDDLIANGTTTALYFATVHQDATRLLVDICLERGQRALIGKVAMDNPDECPAYYRDASPDAAVDGTRALIDYVRGSSTPRPGPTSRRSGSARELFSPKAGKRLPQIDGRPEPPRQASATKLTKSPLPGGGGSGLD